MKITLTDTVTEEEVVVRGVKSFKVTIGRNNTFEVIAIANDHIRKFFSKDPAEIVQDPNWFCEGGHLDVFRNGLRVKR